MTPQEIAEVRERAEHRIRPSWEESIQLLDHIAAQDKHIYRLGGGRPGTKHRHSQDGVSGE